MQHYVYLCRRFNATKLQKQLQRTKNIHIILYINKHTSNNQDMAYRKITAAEGAAMINDGDNIGFSGFTPNGVPKAVIRELSQRAVREHEAGRPFKVGIITGASSCQSLEGDFANAQAIKFRAPFSTNADFRRHANMGEIDYEDMHLGHMAERLRRGFYGHDCTAIKRRYSEQIRL